MADPVRELILRRLAAVKNEVVGEAMGCDASHVSRISAGERGVRLGQIDGLFAALGLTVVESRAGVVSMSAERARALQVLAREALDKDAGI